jgi:hypothetical protein
MLGDGRIPGGVRWVSVLLQFRARIEPFWTSWFSPTEMVNIERGFLGILGAQVVRTEIARKKVKTGFAARFAVRRRIDDALSDSAMTNVSRR